MMSYIHYQCWLSKKIKVGSCDDHMTLSSSHFIGTGIVTSVPSDAPDDYAALRDLKKKKVLSQ